MSTSGDIKALFDRFNGDASTYREIRVENEAREARERWPLLALTGPRGANVGETDRPRGAPDANARPKVGLLGAGLSPRRGPDIAQQPVATHVPSAIAPSPEAPIKQAHVEPAPPDQPAPLRKLFGAAPDAPQRTHDTQDTQHTAPANDPAQRLDSVFDRLRHGGDQSSNPKQR